MSGWQERAREQSRGRPAGVAPEGEHEAVVYGVRRRKWPEHGPDEYTVTYRTAGGHLVDERIDVADDRALWRVLRLARAAGVDPDSRERPEDVLWDAEGAPVVVKVVHKHGTSKTFANVADVQAPAAQKPAAPAPKPAEPEGVACDDLPF